jgi:hypothetical protein
LIRASSVVNCRWTPWAWSFRLAVQAATCLRTSLILPIRAIGISLEQDDGTLDFLRCPFEFFDDGFQLLAFLVGKPNDIFFRIYDNSSVQWGKKAPTI